MPTFILTLRHNGKRQTILHIGVDVTAGGLSRNNSRPSNFESDVFSIFITYN